MIAQKRELTNTASNYTGVFHFRGSFPFRSSQVEQRGGLGTTRKRKPRWRSAHRAPVAKTVFIKVRRLQVQARIDLPAKMGYTGAVTLPDKDHE
jgi:hypothetical protein